MREMCCVQMIRLVISSWAPAWLEKLTAITMGMKIAMEMRAGLLMGGWPGQGSLFGLSD